MVTIKDIAKLAGVSHTTVSRALNHSPLIKLETREKILALAESLNYSPNINAKSLVYQRNFIIGLFFSSLEQGTSSSFLIEAIKGIHEILDENYTLAVKGIDEIKNPEQTNFQRFDGIIIMSQSTGDEVFIQSIKSKKIPLVVLNRQLNDKEIVNVITNESESVAKMIDYAITQGHRKIGYIGGMSTFHSADERKKGLIRSLEQHQIPVHEEFLYTGDYSPESGYHEMKKILAMKELPTLVFCGNDDMAIGAMKAIREKKLHIPMDISLIGFDDISFVNYLDPPLTTIHKPIREISRKGLELLLQLIDNEKNESSVKEVVIESSLVIRSSVRNITET